MMVLLAALLFWAFPVRAEAVRVVVSIKPLHSLAAALLDGIAKPSLLLDGAASPHAHALKPSERRTLQQADVVVWVGPSLEGFLVKPLSVLPENVRVVALLDGTPGLTRLPLGADGHDHHGHEHDHQDNDHHHDDHGHNKAPHDYHDGGDHPAGEPADPHVWLSPANARAIAAHLAEILTPFGNVERLAANAERLDRQLADLEQEVAATLAPVQAVPFVVFHPAYNYFVDAFGLTQAGAIALSPEQGASARHLSELRDVMAESGAVCAFREPQFSGRSVAGLVRDTGLRVAVLDPLGVDVPAGPAAYGTILRNLAASFTQCLSR
jgi:zinc transport system substrate-binding protein